MIIDAIVAIATSLLSYILSLFPDIDTNALAVIDNALYDIKGYFVGFNWIFPVDTFFFCMNITVGVLVAIGLVRLFRWIGSVITHNTIH